MKNALTSFSNSIQYILRDKVNFALTSLPILIGLILYYYLGATLFDYGMNTGKTWVDNYIENSTANLFLSYTVQIILYIVLFFIINWTFVMVVSIIASPFNDVMSSRIEKKVNGEALPTMGVAFGSAFKNFFMTIFIEIKKLLFIFFLTVLALLLNFIPFLTPLSRYAT